MKITKGKSFDSGVVFVDGKFIPPPYVVERYGNVIRINGVQVTNPIVDWSEFLKTQGGLTVATTETVVEPPEPAADPTPAPEAPALSDSNTDDDPLADLFDDAPAKSKAPTKASVPVATPKTVVTKKMKLDGEFELNDRAKGLVGKINLMRTDIDAALRRGGFFCFGSSYSRVSGEKSLSKKIMSEIPRIMKQHSEFAEFADAVRQAGFVYFPPKLVRDLHANRLDYLVLQKRYKKMQDAEVLSAMLEQAGASDF